MINWMTEQEAKDAAAKGLIPAIEHSIVHHGQNEKATYKELVQAAIGSIGIVEGRRCARCQVEEESCKDGKCSLKDAGVCCQEWRDEVISWDKFKRDHSLSNYTAFTQAAGVMVKRLEKELELARHKQIAKDYAEFKKAKEAEKKIEPLRCSDCKYQGFIPIDCPCRPCNINTHNKWEPKGKAKPELRHGDVYPAYGEGGEPCVVIGNGRNATSYDRNDKERNTHSNGKKEGKK